MTGERTRSLLLVVLGATAAWLWWSGAALNYVRASLGPLLLAGGVVFLLLGLAPPFGLLDRGRPGQADRHREARIGWLLLVPVLVLVVVQPAALGSYAAAGRSAVPAGAGGDYPPLAAPVRGAVPMTMAEFVTRALRDRARSLDGVRVRLVGFASPAKAAGGYQLTRFVIFCCAADAEALQVEVRGDRVRRAPDQWLEVEGRWAPRPVAGDHDPDPPPPALTATAVHPIPAPRPPYEYTVTYGG